MPTYPSSPGLKAIVAKALTDLKTLEEAGFDGALVENDNDQPHQIKVSKEISESFAAVMEAVLAKAKMPVGMEIIYDMMETVGVAKLVHAQFVRLDVFVDNVETRWGRIPAQAGELAKLRGQGGPLLFTDIHVKHAKVIDGKSIEQSAAEAIAGGSDALIVTGTWTGNPPALAACSSVKGVAGEFPVLVGSGLSTENAPSLMGACDGAIVGTSIKTGDYIDIEKASALAELFKKLP